MTPDRQAAISRWLIDSGCLYVMATGSECSSWDDSVSLANAEACDSRDIPDDRVVITTLHEDEPLKEVFWFSKYSAMHPCFSLDNVVLLHLSLVERKQELVAEYLVA